MRLALFVDQLFWREGNVLSTNESYILFPASFVQFVEELVLIGRTAAEPGRAPYVIDHPAIKFIPLPYYQSLYELWRASPRIYGQMRQIIRQNAGSWDAILISGPHPIGQMVAKAMCGLWAAGFFDSSSELGPANERSQRPISEGGDNRGIGLGMGFQAALP